MNWLPHSQSAPQTLAEPSGQRGATGENSNLSPGAASGCGGLSWGPVVSHQTPRPTPEVPDCMQEEALLPGLLSGPDLGAL